MKNWKYIVALLAIIAAWMFVKLRLLSWPVHSKNEIVLGTNSMVITLDGPTNTWKTNSTDIIQTNKFVFKESGTLLMTLSNQSYVQLFAGFIIRASDEDWNRITNCYRDQIQTNAIEIWCP